MLRALIFASLALYVKVCIVFAKIDDGHVHFAHHVYTRVPRQYTLQWHAELIMRKNFCEEKKCFLLLLLSSLCFMTLITAHVCV